MMSNLGRILVATLLATSFAEATAPEALDARRHHLGVAGRPEWAEFEKDVPEGRSLELRFAGHANADAATLLIRQGGVKLNWAVRLNGRSIGRLLPMEDSLVHALAVPAGALRDGPNTLSVDPPAEPDDIVIDEVTLDPRPRAVVLSGATLDVAVDDRDSGRGLPARITVVDRRGALASVGVEPGGKLAARPGVVYTPDGRARFGVPPGEYTVYATRGFEYGVDRREVTVAGGATTRVALAIRRPR